MGDGLDAMEIAIKRGHLSTIEIFLEFYPHLKDCACASGMVPILAAIQHDRLDVAQLLLERGADADLINEAGSSVLFDFMHSSDVDVCSLLIPYMKNVDIMLDGYTPLQWTVSDTQTQLMEMLIEAKADPDVTLGDGSAVLHHASQMGQTFVVKMLLD